MKGLPGGGACRNVSGGRSLRDPISFLLPTSSLRRLKSGVVSSTRVPLRLTGTSTHMSSAKSKYSFFL